MSLHLFRFKEGIATNYLAALPSYFRISATTTYDVLILRTLAGTLDFEHNRTGAIVKLKTNYCTLPKSVLKRKSAVPIRAILHPFSYDDYTRYSKKFAGLNINFYNNILNELTFYLWYSNTRNYQSAFVNLYRLLEYISYSFPLIHSSHYGNYVGTFTALKSYFVDAKTSELKFFELFTANLFNGTPFLGMATDFEFSNADLTVAQNCFDAFRNLMRPTDWLLVDPVSYRLQIENKKLIELFKNTRNRYFHFGLGSGQRNIHSSDLKDPDFFFERINEAFLNWVGFIYAEIIRNSLDNTIL